MATYVTDDLESLSRLLDTLTGSIAVVCEDATRRDVAFRYMVEHYKGLLPEVFRSVHGIKIGPFKLRFVPDDSRGPMRLEGLILSHIVFMGQIKNPRRYEYLVAFASGEGDTMSEQPSDFEDIQLRCLHCRYEWTGRIHVEARPLPWMECPHCRDFAGAERTEVMERGLVRKLRKQPKRRKGGLE